ncbi:trimethylamine-N-oxide reductase [Vibrio variabilis]|uniref:Trimethylamine-N-oxide reductase n=1 Tax=Vibrio variabilis TaxID=990271 RepID=A0ABQ0JA90_9VIBR|nr:trimethylamine-N-oxide reductase [Vibrio variabilis]
MWFEKSERSHGGPGSDKHPYWLQSCHPDKRLHSQMCESEEFRATYAVQGRELSTLTLKMRNLRALKMVI